jgi:hypothetical protein
MAGDTSGFFSSSATFFFPQFFLFSFCFFATLKTDILDFEWRIWNMEVPLICFRYFSRFSAPPPNHYALFLLREPSLLFNQRIANPVHHLLP